MSDHPIRKYLSDEELHLGFSVDKAHDNAKKLAERLQRSEKLLKEAAHQLRAYNEEELPQDIDSFLNEIEPDANIYE